ncbi:hypothetical protein MNBD_GAMMA22-1576 [hydrothermal vent metagenome]|uniref:Uncharacterized protein n=1 Tax=hydrothermal vent metagenome TaxID=652676 RepID=A0A3B1B0K4_9ZZZZ
MKTSIKLFLLLYAFSMTACATQTNEIQSVLDQQQAPAGVVFEVVSLFEGSIQTAIPKIVEYSSQLRKRFPNISIAVVTHGNEQFALTTKNKSEYTKTHQQVQNLAENGDIPVHVCAVYAERKGVSESEFPDYINIAASGPSQINNYRELGYVHIKLSNW